MVDLSHATLDMYRDGRSLPAFILTRACIETSGLQYLLRVKAISFLKNSDEDVFDNFLRSSGDTDVLMRLPNNYVNASKHHEIYLSVIRKANPKNWKIVIRQPMI